MAFFSESDGGSFALDDSLHVSSSEVSSKSSSEGLRVLARIRDAVAGRLGRGYVPAANLSNVPGVPDGPPVMPHVQCGRSALNSWCTTEPTAAGASAIQLGRT